MRTPALLRVAVFVSTLTVASSALACPVCFSAKNEASRVAFILTTVGLTVLPLMFIAWGVFWVIRREREQEASDNAARNEGTQSRITPAHVETPAT